MNFTVEESALRLVDMALAEDRGAGDWTTRWIVPARKRATASIVAHSEGIVAGLSVASAVFLRLDPRVECSSTVSDGDAVKPGDVLFTVRGPARALITGEQTAVNFMRRLCAVATETRKFVDAVAGTDAGIADTRNTTPAWRIVEKAAAQAGGARPSRAGLHDEVLIAREHVEIAGNIAKAIQLIRDANSRELKLGIEVRDKEQLKEALDAGCDSVVLVEMDVQAMREAVRVIRKATPQVQIVAAGKMTLDRVRAVAETGVDLIAVNTITQAPPFFDLSLRFLGS